MLPNIKITIIKPDHKFYYEQMMLDQIYYACFYADNFELYLSFNSSLSYKNIRMRAYGISASHWSLGVYNEESNYPIKELGCNTEYFDYSDCSQKEKPIYQKILKKSVETAAISNSIISEAVEETNIDHFIEEKVFEACVARNQEIYNLIEDKERFKEELLWCEENPSLLVCSYNDESDLDKSDEAEILAELDSEINSFAKSSAKYFKAFADSEHCKEILKKELTKRALRARYPEVEQIINDDFLINKINEFIDIFEYEDYISIDFDRKSFVEEAINYFFNSEIKNLFLMRLKQIYTREHLSKIYENELKSVHDSDDLLNELEKYIKRNTEYQEELLLQKIKDFTNSYIKYDEYFENFNNIYGGNEKELNLTEDKEARFIAFEKGAIELTTEEENEYNLIYKIAIPSYKSFFYLQNGKSYKPTIRRVPLYFEFFNEFLQRLMEREILVYKDGKLDFKAIERIADLDEADYNPLEYYKKRSKRIILQNLKNDPYISLNELANKTSYSTRAVRERLQELEYEGYIEIIGEGKKRYYIIKHEIQ